MSTVEQTPEIVQPPRMPDFMRLFKMLEESPVVCSAQLDKLFEALAKAQAEFPAIPKNKTATVVMKDDKGKYSYNYADLADVISVVAPVAGKHGLSCHQHPVSHPKSGQPGCLNLLGHSSGQFIASMFFMTGRPQDIGSMLTYTRRYQEQAAFGVQGESDDDSNLAHGYNFSAERRAERPQPPKGNVRRPESQAPQQEPPANTAPPPEKKPAGKKKPDEWWIEYTGKEVAKAVEANNTARLDAIAGGIAKADCSPAAKMIMRGTVSDAAPNIKKWLDESFQAIAMGETFDNLAVMIDAAQDLGDGGRSLIKYEVKREIDARDAGGVA